MPTDPLPPSAGLEIATFNGTTSQGLTSPLNLSDLPVVKLNANQALELLENISRDPEGQKLAQFIALQIQAGRRLVVTEDMKLSKFVRIVPEGWEYAKDFDVYDGRVAEIRNIKVGGNFHLNGTYREGADHVKNILGVKVKGGFVVENACGETNLDVDAGSFVTNTFRDGKNVLGNVAVRTRTGMAIQQLKCGDLTGHSRGDISLGYYKLKAKNVDVTSKGNVTLYNVTADNLAVHAKGNITKSCAYGLNIETAALEAGGRVEFNTSEPHQSQGAAKEISIRNITVVAGGEVKMSLNQLEEADIISGGDINVSRAPKLRKLRAIATNGGKISAWNSAVSEITPDSQGDWDLENTPNLDSKGPPPRRGLTTASVGALFTVDKLVAAVQRQTEALPPGSPPAIDQAK